MKIERDCIRLFSSVIKLYSKSSFFYVGIIRPLSSVYKTCFFSIHFFILFLSMIETTGLGKTIIAGGVGGVSIWGAIYPFDIIKSRMQVKFTKY